MTSKWETEDERALRFMSIPVKKKLTWLYEMNKFLNNFSSGKTRKIRQNLRE
ncbi:MAG: hypothetical protein NTX01_08895 [Candidatus Omnitrophica bacterium]|nr:hypothetical protein [Candidatus Omnitrophota bacterium]